MNNTNIIRIVDPTICFDKGLFPRMLMIGIRSPIPLNNPKVNNGKYWKYNKTILISPHREGPNIFAAPRLKRNNVAV